jgi:type II secretory pathway pseudopilin PulG
MKKLCIAKSGFGLVEALIALVIIAMTMIAALRTVSSALRGVKNNETEDKANELMTSALEYAYGYRNIDLPKVSGGADFPIQSFIDNINQAECYTTSYDLASNPPVSTLIHVANGIDNCKILQTTDDRFDVTITGQESTEVIYHQVIFTNVPVTGSGTDKLEDKFRITSIVLYEFEGQILRQRVDAYRPLYY